MIWVTFRAIFTTLRVCRDFAWSNLEIPSSLPGIYPDPREDLESRTPNMVPYTTIGYFLGTVEGDLLSRSSQRSGYQLAHARVSRSEDSEFKVSSHP